MKLLWIEVGRVYDDKAIAFDLFLSDFMQGLAKLGWTDGGNVRMEVRWAGGHAAALPSSVMNLRRFIDGNALSTASSAPRD